METHEVVGILLLLRDVLARSLFAKYREDLTQLSRVLDAYEPVAEDDPTAAGYGREKGCFPGTWRLAAHR